MLPWPGLFLFVSGSVILVRARTFARLRIQRHEARRAGWKGPDPSQVEPNRLDIRLARLAGAFVAVLGVALIYH